MDYEQTLAFLYALLPMYQRQGSSAIKKDLTNTIALCQHLGEPHQNFKSIHVAGTNGKGSSSHWLAAILQEAGFKVGLYTSPHLKNFTERIRINGTEIPQGEVVSFVQDYRLLIEEIKPSFFELTVAMAFDFFAKEEVDFAVIEVGLGGRLDSTNVITPIVSLITNIGFDHMDMLGNTLTEIAREKAGIIKEGVPVVVSEYQEEPAVVFKEVAKSKNALLTFASENIQVVKGNDGFVEITNGLGEKLPGINPGLLGKHQLRNLVGVIQVVDLLNKEYSLEIPENAIVSGVGQVVSLTGLKGRFQIIRKEPLMIADVAHNVDGLKMVLAHLLAQTCKRLHIVIGFVKEKQVKEMLAILPKEAFYYYCKPNIPRGLDAKELEGLASSIGLSGEVFSSVEKAIEKAKEKAETQDLIYIGGSTFVVAEVPGL